MTCGKASLNAEHIKTLKQIVLTILNGDKSAGECI